MPAPTMKRPLLLLPLLALALPALGQDPATNAPQSSRKEAVATGFDVAAACHAVARAPTRSFEVFPAGTGRPPLNLPDGFREKLAAAFAQARNGTAPTNSLLLKHCFEVMVHAPHATVSRWEAAMGLESVSTFTFDEDGNRIQLGPDDMSVFPFLIFRPDPRNGDALVHFLHEIHPGAPVAVVPGLGPLLESAAAASQRPVDPEPPSPPSGPVAEKMKRVVLPIVDFRLSPITEVVAVLEDLARNHDDPIAAARGQGLTFVLDLPSDAADSLPLVTCVMKSVSVYSALDMIAEMSGLEWRVDGDVVRLTLAARSSGEDKPHAENAENAEPDPDAESEGVDGGCFPL